MNRKRWVILVLLTMPLLSLLPSCLYTAPYRRVESVREGLKTPVVKVSAMESRFGQRKAFFGDTQRVLADLPKNWPKALRLLDTAPPDE